MRPGMAPACSRTPAVLRRGARRGIGWPPRPGRAARPAWCRRALVNAAGPWAQQFLQVLVPACAHQAQRLVKGSHIVVKRLFEHPYAYIFQHPDRRIVFAIPYERDFTLIGTTDVDYHGDLDRVAISAEEIDYLCRLCGRYFQQALGARDVLWSYAGVRPLLGGVAGAAGVADAGGVAGAAGVADAGGVAGAAGVADAGGVAGAAGVADAGGVAGAGAAGDAVGSTAAATRDYLLEHDSAGAPLLSVFGGKITTFRKLAEEALDWLAPDLGCHAGSWTAGACLPGGDIFGPAPTARAVLEFDTFIAAQQGRHPWLAPELVARYARAYGTRMALLLDGGDGRGDPAGPVRR